MHSSPIGDLLAKWSHGDQDELRALVPLLYDDLRHLHRERYPQAPFQNRAHVVAVCAMVMRQILSRFERDRRAARRGGGEEDLTLAEAGTLTRMRSIDFIALDDALEGLVRLDPQQIQIIELRFLLGLSIDEIADVPAVSPAAVKRHWETARVCLRREMIRGGAA